MSTRHAPIAMGGAEFRKIGYQLIDTIAGFIDTIEERPVTTGEPPGQLKKRMGISPLPAEGTPADQLLLKASELVLNHSLLNGHPRFLGYITSSAAPIGALADLLASSVNPNVGAQILSPVATEIERQTVSWLAELIGVSPSYGGILVSGGNMANFTAFLAARTAKAPKSFKADGLVGDASKMVFYCSSTAHTWVEKAAVLFGHGAKSIRWIRTDDKNRLDNEALASAIANDIRDGLRPFMVIGTAGDVSTGVVDNLSAIGTICKKNNLWFHIDGAYGVPAALIPELKSLFEGIGEADSIAMDPHKWLYSPLEAGCTLVKNPNHLTDTYSAHPDYYNFANYEESPAHNYYEYGLQNSRGFRALKVWLMLQQVGKNGYATMIREDIALSKLFYTLASDHAELEAVTQNLSITTLRYVPPSVSSTEKEQYLNKLNEALLNELQQGGEVFLSNAIVQEKYCLRGCIVNFRTSREDIERIIEVIVREGRKRHKKMTGENPE